MKWYHITNNQKYGIYEMMTFVNRATNKTMIVSTNWKWGGIDVQASEKPESVVDENLYDLFEEVAINILDSGVENFEFHDYETGERIELDTKLIDAYQDEGINALYEAGFTDEIDPEIYIDGGITAEETSDPYEIDVNFDT